MDISFLILIGLVAIIVVCLVCIGIDWSRFFGYEIIEQDVSFGGRSLMGKDVADLFIKVVETLRNERYYKHLTSIIYHKDFFSICAKGFESDQKQWSRWQPFDRFRNLLIEDYSCKFKTVWVIQIEANFSMICFVHNDDKSLFEESLSYNGVKLTSSYKISKTPWNHSRIKKQKEFINKIASTTNKLISN